MLRLPKSLIALVFAGTIRLSFAAANRPATAPIATQPTSAPAADADALLQEDPGVEAKLAQPIKELSYNKVPLSQVFDDLASKSGVKIEVDWDVLARANISKEATVRVRLRNVKPSRALAMVFKSVEGEDNDHKLGYFTDNGSVHVTTLPGLAKRAVERTYDIGDLLSDQPSLPNAAKIKGPIATKWPGEILRFIVDNVDSKSWKINGGNVGEIRYVEAKHAVVIKQTPEAHTNISELLASLRNPKLTQPAPATAPSIK